MGNSRNDGMLFYDATGQMYLSVHSPNTATDTRGSMPVFVKVEEENGTIKWGVRKEAGYMFCQRYSSQILIYPTKENEDKIFAVYGKDGKLISVLHGGGCVETNKGEVYTVKALGLDRNGKTTELETQILK